MLLILTRTSSHRLSHNNHNLIESCDSADCKPGFVFHICDIIYDICHI